MSSGSESSTVLLPWLLGVATAANSSVAMFVHQPTGSITLVEGSLDVESLLLDVPAKEGPLPASKASIESLARVRIPDPGQECPICLAGYEAEAKEMPCGHKFHSGCLDRWLGIRRSCPLCRFSLPAAADSDGWRIHHVFVVDSVSEPDTGTDEVGRLESGHVEEPPVDDSD